MDLLTSILNNVQLPNYVHVNYRVEQPVIPADKLPEILHESILNCETLEKIQSEDKVAIAVAVVKLQICLLLWKRS